MVVFNALQPANLSEPPKPKFFGGLWGRLAVNLGTVTSFRPNPAHGKPVLKTLILFNGGLIHASITRDSPVTQGLRAEGSC